MIEVLAACGHRPLQSSRQIAFNGDRQQNLLAQHVLKQQALALIITDLGLRRCYRNLFLARIGALRSIQQIELAAYLFDHRLQATGANQFQAGGELAIQPYIIDYVMLTVMLLHQLRTPRGLSTPWLG